MALVRGLAQEKLALKGILWKNGFSSWENLLARSDPIQRKPCLVCKSPVFMATPGEILSEMSCDDGAWQPGASYFVVWRPWMVGEPQASAEPWQG